MKKFVTASFCCFCVVINVIGQTEIDTLYYDRNWKGCEKPFAAYYRVYALSPDNNLKKKYRDFYITGELQSEGEYISIDKLDDSKSVFDGEYITYYKSGKTEQKGYCENGKQEGEWTKYKEDGLILLHAYFKDDNLHGIYTEFSEDGSLCTQIEYANGRPLHNYYTISNKDGFCSKVSLSNKRPVYESPLLCEKQTEYNDGKEWPYYNKNGIMVGMTNSKVSDYGKYFQLSIVIANNSMFPIELDPDNIQASLIKKSGEEKVLKVYSAEEYMRKVRRRQNWAIALNAIGEGMSAATAGLSTSTTKTSYSGSSSTTGNASAYGNNGYAYGNYAGTSSYYGSSTSITTTYDAATAYQAQVIASERIATYNHSLLSERTVKEKGYLKRTTIYPGETISGDINIEHEKGISMTVSINICGATYSFSWNLNK